MATISVDGVTKVFGDTVALEDVSFRVPDGEFMVLLGPSGAGKSTLLRVLNGLTDPTEGTVEIDGRPVTGTRSDIAMVFQLHYLVESMSAYRNTLTGALARESLGRSAVTAYDEVEKLAALEALQTVGLLDEADQRADSMSGGQQQRVGIARALMQEPSLLLADEPVASLDPKAANEVMGYMKKAAVERGLTTIASLHQVNIAREFGDRFVGLRDGRVVFDGTAEDLTMDEVDRIYYGESKGGVSASTDITAGEAAEAGTGSNDPKQPADATNPGD